MPKRSASSVRLLPYFSCSSSARTISPPPARTHASTASSSPAERRGAPEPGTTRSHFGSDGCAITSTAAPSRVPASSGPDACALTAKLRARRASAARAYEESSGCEGCISRAISGRIVQAWLCASSKTTRAISGCVGIFESVGEGRVTVQHRSVSILHNNVTNGRHRQQDRCAVDGGRAPALRRHRPPGVALGAGGEAPRRPPALERRAAGVHGGARPRLARGVDGGARGALLRSRHAAGRGGPDAGAPPRGGRGVERDRRRRRDRPRAHSGQRRPRAGDHGDPEGGAGGEDAVAGGAVAAGGAADGVGGRGLGSGRSASWPWRSARRSPRLIGVRRWAGKGWVPSLAGSRHALPHGVWLVDGRGPPPGREL